MASLSEQPPSNRFVLLQALFALPFILGGILMGTAVWMLVEDGGRVAGDCATCLLISLPLLGFGGIGMIRLHIRSRHVGDADHLRQVLRSRTAATNIALGLIATVLGVFFTWYLRSRRNEVSLESHLLYVLGVAELLYGLWQVLRGHRRLNRPDSGNSQRCEGI
jgi:hypothetical protein